MKRISTVILIVITLAINSISPANAAVTWSQTSSFDIGFNGSVFNSQYDLQYTSAYIFDNDPDKINFYLELAQVPTINMFNTGKGSFGVVYKIDDRYIYKTIIFKSDKVYYNELKALFLNYLLTLYYNDKPGYSRYLCKLYEFGFIGEQPKNLYCIQENGGDDLYKYLQKKCTNFSWKRRDDISKMKYFLEILLQCLHQGA